MHAREASAAIGPPLDLQRLHRSLTACQVSFQQLDNGFKAVYSRHRFMELAWIAGAQGGEWLLWSNTAVEAIEHCRQIMSQEWLDCLRARVGGI